MPTCPDHRFHRMGDKYRFIPSRRMVKTPRSTTKVNLPAHMLKGKRRYSPTWKKKKRRTKISTVKMTTVKTNKKKTSPGKPPAQTFRTVIIKKETVIKNGKKVLKVVKGLVKKKIKVTNNDKSDFLQ